MQYEVPRNLSTAMFAMYIDFNDISKQNIDLSAARTLGGIAGKYNLDAAVDFDPNPYISRKPTALFKRAAFDSEFLKAKLKKSNLSWIDLPVYDKRSSPITNAVGYYRTPGFIKPIVIIGAHRDVQ